MTKLWKTVTTILSNKSISNEKVVLIENEKKNLNNGDVAKIHSM